jgi:hypothetical protein
MWQEGQTELHCHSGRKFLESPLGFAPEGDYSLDRAVT